MNKACCIVVAFIASLSAYSLPEIKDSYISNQVSGQNTATGKSTINTGINLQGTNVDNSVIINQSSGNINASNRSNVNTGVNVTNSQVDNSYLSANSNVNINAKNSNVETGINLLSAQGSNISTNVTSNINAENATVNVGSVQGTARGTAVTTSVSDDVSAKNKAVNVGSVFLAGGGRSASYGSKNSDGYGARRDTAGSQNIGNVVVNSDKVKSVSTTVGDGAGIGETIKTKHMANYYKDKDGVAPDGTKYIYVSGKDRDSAERRGESTGNTVINSDSKVRKVKSIVE